MKKLIVGMLAALSVSSLWAETLGWYRFEEFAQGAKPTDGAELVNSTPGGASATLRVYDTSDDKYIPVAAFVGTNVQVTVNDFCPVKNNRSLNFQRYGKWNGSAIVVPEWEAVDASGPVTPSSFTVESFFKLNGMSVTDGYRTFFSKTGTGMDGQTFRVYMITEKDPGSDKLYVYLNDVLYRIDGVAATIRDGVWHHLALAYDADRQVAKVYFDAVEVLSVTVALNAYEGSRSLFVGSAGVFNTAGGGTNWNCFPGYVDEVRISDKALVADELLRMRPADWTAPDTLDISRTPALLPAPTVTTNVSARLPGLRCGSKSYADSAAAGTAWGGTEVFTTSTSLSPAMAYKAGTKQDWTENTLWTYSGYIWNRNETTETWTFASCILARGSVFVDGERVVYNQGPAGTSADGGVKQGNVTVSPGAHKFEVRLQSAAVTESASIGGGAYYSSKLANDHGTESGYTWAAGKGIMLDRQGRGSHNVADYAKIVDAGDGALLTQTDALDVVTRTPNFAVSTLVATGGVSAVDFDSCDYAFRGVLGSPAILRCGNLSISESLTVGRGAYAGQAMTSDGRVTFGEGAKVVVDFAGRFRPTTGSVTILTAADGIVGEPTLEVAAGIRGTFSLRKSDDGKSLILGYQPDGMMLIFR